MLCHAGFEIEDARYSADAIFASYVARGLVAQPTVRPIRADEHPATEGWLGGGPTRPDWHRRFRFHPAKIESRTAGPRVPLGDEAACRTAGGGQLCGADARLPDA
jgi:hypothetical protein